MEKKRFPGLLVGCLLAAGLMVACGKDDEAPPVEEEVTKPTADFDYEQIEENDPFTYQFTNASTDYEVIRWLFGDDSTSTEVSPQHTFLQAGTYRVTMIAEGARDYWAEKEVRIPIIADSIVDFTATPDQEGSLTLEVESQTEVESMQWFYQVDATTFELISTEPSPRIEVGEGSFDNYMLRIQTPRGSVASITRLVSTLGIVTDLTDRGNLSVSRDNNGGPEAGEGSLKLVDGNIGSKFLQFDYTGDLWCQLEYPEPVIAGAYTLTSANDAPERDPKDWRLEGSDDGTTWTELDVRADEEFEDRFVTKTYSFENTTPYRFYRLSLTANRGSGLIQIAEWRLLQLPQ